MRYFIILIFISCSLFAKQQLLEIYTDRSYLTERFDVGSGSFESNVPEFITLESLHIKSPCLIKEKTLGEAVVLQNHRQAKIEEAETVLKEAKIALNAHEAKERLLERTTVNIDSMGNIKDEVENFSLYMKQTLNKKEELKKDLQDAQTALDKLKNSGSSLVKPLKISLECDAPSILELRYPLKEISANRRVTLAGDEKEGLLDIDQSLFIKHTLGADLKNLTLHLYGFAYSDRLAPPTFYPWYIDTPKPILTRSVIAKASDSSNISTQQAPPTTQMSQSKHFWEVSNLNLPNNRSIQVPLDSQRVFAKFDIFIDGYAENFAYTKAHFTPEVFIEKAEAELVLGGMLLGNQNIPRLNAKKESSLFFGKNELINVKKDLREDFATHDPLKKEETSQMLWRYTITNNDTKTHDFILSERLPISKDGEISVKLLGDEPSSSNAKGNQSYSFTLEAGQSKKIDFGYAITKPLSDK